MYPMPASRFRRRHTGYQNRLVTLAGLMAVLLFLFSQTTSAVAWATLETYTDKMSEKLLETYYRQDSMQILQCAMPLLRWSSLADGSHTVDPSQPLMDALSALLRVDLGSPVAVLKSQMPMLVMSAPPETVAVSRSGGIHRLETETSEPLLNNKTATLPEEAIVLIYNTHTGETFSMTDRTERLDGRQGGVVTVAAALQAALENEHGIKTIRSDRIHDISYDNAYDESEKTLGELLAAAPKTKVVLDIHRDAAKSREQSLVKINGENVAPLLFITGPGLRYPTNYAFSTRLAAKANELYPGLSLGVTVKNSEYNQHLHPQTVLVEIGTSNNSLEEALRSAALFADVLAQVLTSEDWI